MRRRQAPLSDFWLYPLPIKVNMTYICRMKASCKGGKFRKLHGAGLKENFRPAEL